MLSLKLGVLVTCQKLERCGPMGSLSKERLGMRGECGTWQPSRTCLPISSCHPKNPLQIVPCPAPWLRQLHLLDRQVRGVLDPSARILPAAAETLAWGRSHVAVQKGRAVVQPPTAAGWMMPPMGSPLSASSNDAQHLLWHQVSKKKDNPQIQR